MGSNKGDFCMLQIITDTSSLYDPKTARENGFYSVPLSVILNGTPYREMEEISAAALLDEIQGGFSLSTSQPSLGEKLDLYNALLESGEDEILDLTICDGISGTYQTSMMAKESCLDPERVTVVDTSALCFGQRVLVDLALELRDKGLGREEIAKRIEACRDSDASAVVCMDPWFLANGGRLPKIAGKAGSALKLLPIACKKGYSQKLGVLGIARTQKKAFDKIYDMFEEMGVNNLYEIGITHAHNPEGARKALEYFQAKYPFAHIRVYEMNPLFIAHGGPGCVAIQAISTTPWKECSAIAGKAALNKPQA